MTATPPNPILRDVATTLETPRLVLRCPRAGDGAAIHAAVSDSLAELRAWPASLPWAVMEPTVDGSELFCRESEAHFIRRSSLTYFAWRRDGGAFAVSCGLHRMDWKVPRFEVGYWCHSHLHGQGYASEAVGALVRYAIDVLGARRVDCYTDEANLASRRVAEKAGLQLEGVMRHERVAPDGQLRNTCLYALVR